MPIGFIFLNIVLILLSGAAGVWLSRSRRRALAGIALSAALVGAGVGVILRPDLAVAVVPIADLIFVENLFPLAAALFIPCAWSFGRTKGQRVRIAVLCTLLSVITLKGYQPFFQPRATSYEHRIDEDGVCRQSSADTCSAAALVTLFRQYGIETTEAEMIDLAGTRSDHGTTHLGLYRALCIKTRGRRHLHPALRKESVEMLLQRNEPAVITVGLPRTLTLEAREFGRKYNWQPGILHDVAFLGKDPDRPGHVLIGEPDYGLESWEVQSLRFLYYGFAATLDERK